MDHRCLRHSPGAFPDDPRLERLRPGQKYVLPVKEDVEALRSKQTLMRNLIDSMTFSVAGFKPYRWLPYTAYDRFIERWTSLRSQFYAIKAQIIEKMDYYTDQLAAQSAREAEQSWKAITGQDYQWVIIDGRPYDHDSYIDIMVKRDLLRLPSVEKIERELQAVYTVALVYGTQDLENDRLAAERIRLQGQVEREQAQAAEQTDYLQTRLAQEQYDHQRRINQIEQQERELRIEAMLHAEAEHARQQLGEIASPFAEVFTALRGQIAQGADEILKSIRKNGHVVGNVARRGRGLVEIFDLLAVQNDHELRAKLVELKNAIGLTGDERAADTPEQSTEEVIGILEQIRELEHQAVRDMLAGPSRFSNVEI